MAFAGGLGAAVTLDAVPNDSEIDVATLFSESNSRFICEVPVGKKAEFERLVSKVPYAAIGEVADTGHVVIVGSTGESLIDGSIADLKEAWQSPLRW